MTIAVSEMPKKKCKTILKSKENAVNDKEFRFYKNPVTIKQRMDNARSMDLFNANYEDDIFDQFNNNNAENRKVTTYFKLDISSSSLDTLGESDESYSSPFVVPPPLRSSACQSRTPGKSGKHVSPMKR